MISQNHGGLPIFLADLGVAVKDGIERYGLDGFAPGDVVIMNHGQVCGQHLNNVVIYAPCFHDGKVVGVRGEPRPLGRYRRHARRLRLCRDHRDLSGRHAVPLAEDLRGAASATRRLWQIIDDNVRFPEAALGDLRAQIACCQSRHPAVFGELLRALSAATTVEACIARGLGRRPSAKRAPSSARFPTASTRRRAFSTMTGAISTCRCASKLR